VSPRVARNAALAEEHGEGTPYTRYEAPALHTSTRTPHPHQRTTRGLIFSWRVSMSAYKYMIPKKCTTFYHPTKILA